MDSYPHLYMSARDGSPIVSSSLELLRLLQVGHHGREETPGFAAGDGAMIESERKRQHPMNGRRTLNSDHFVAYPSRPHDSDRRRHHHG